MKPRHTPGPWRVVLDKDLECSTKGWPVAIFQDRMVISAPCHDMERGSLEADTALLAAAPSLLDAATFAIAVLEATGLEQQPELRAVLADLEYAVRRAQGGAK